MSAVGPAIFFGSSEISARILEALIADKTFRPAAVVTQAPHAHGHASTKDTPVALVAEKYDIPLLRPHKATDAIEDIRQLSPLIGILFAYGQILPAELLEAFPLGIINIHPSLLPRHRGPSPIEATILAGDTMAGTSIMKIEPALDAGPILAQDRWPITTTISKAELTEQLVQASLKLLVPTLNAYVDGTLAPQPQDDTRATYCTMIRKQDGQLDPALISAITLERTVRAYQGWPGVTLDVLVRDQRTQLKLHAVTVTDPASAHSQARLFAQDKKVFLELREGTVEITEAQFPGKKRVAGQDLANGPTLALTTPDTSGSSRAPEKA